MDIDLESGDPGGTKVRENLRMSVVNVTEPESQKKKNSEYLKAVDDGKLETVINLLNTGAEIQSKDEDGDSALHLAASSYCPSKNGFTKQQNTRGTGPADTLVIINIVNGPGRYIDTIKHRQ